MDSHIRNIGLGFDFLASRHSGTEKGISFEVMQGSIIETMNPGLPMDISKLKEMKGVVGLLTYPGCEPSDRAPLFLPCSSHLLGRRDKWGGLEAYRSMA
jgi:hypothetical protein